MCNTVVCVSFYFNFEILRVFFYDFQLFVLRRKEEKKNIGNIYVFKWQLVQIVSKSILKTKLKWNQNLHTIIL